MAMYQTAEQRRKQRKLDTGIDETSPNGVPAFKPRTGSDPAPPKPYDPILNSSLRRADRTVLGSNQNATLAPMSQHERDLASRGQVPAPLRMEGDPAWKYDNADPLNIPQIRTGAPVMLPVQQQSPIARAVNGATKWLDAAIHPAQPSAPSAPIARPALDPRRARSALDRSEMDPFNLNKPGHGVLAPSQTAPAATHAVAPQAPTQQRLSGEMSMLEKERRHVIQQLLDLGPAYGQTPEQAARRATLIERRRLLETRGQAIGAAREPLPSVPADKMFESRDRLSAQTGVDLRPPAEREMAGRMGGVGLIGGAAPTIARGIGHEFETAAYRTREMERAARARAGMDALVNPLPGQEPVLGAIERERNAARQRELDAGTLEQARRAREIEDAKQGDPARRMADAQISGVQAEADLKKSQARNYSDLSDLQRQELDIKRKQLDDPNSEMNQKRKAEQAMAGREAATAISGTVPGAVLPASGEIADRIGSRFFEKSGWLTRMMNQTGFPLKRSDIGANFFDGQSIQEDLADLDTLDTMVVRRLEQLAQAGDTLNAQQDAAAVLARFPRPINGQAYTSNYAPAQPFADKLNQLRNRLSVLAGQ